MTTFTPRPPADWQRLVEALDYLHATFGVNWSQGWDVILQAHEAGELGLQPKSMDDWDYSIHSIKVDMNGVRTLSIGEPAKANAPTARAAKPTARIGRPGKLAAVMAALCDLYPPDGVCPAGVTVKEMMEKLRSRMNDPKLSRSVINNARKQLALR